MQKRRLEKYNPIITCEGETEKWYFEHLQKLINACPRRCYDVVLKPDITKDPKQKAKSINMLFQGIKWYHILDTETSSGEDQNNFKQSLKSFKDTNKIRKGIKLRVGYSNISFELWLLLHKACIKPSVCYPSDYWRHIKKAFNLKDIGKFSDYKKEHNYRKILSQLTLDNVKIAIKRAEEIEKENIAINTSKNISSFSYFEENPSLSIHKVIQDILNEVGLF